MREILFRGKRVDNGEWIRGDLITTPFIRNTAQQNIIYILDITKADYDCFEDLVEDNGIFEVVPETVCQYTGLTDKNGRKIFEGDIVKSEIKINDFSRDSVKNEINTYEVSYHEKYCYFYLKRKNNNLLFDGNWSYYLKEIEVIGNIFDNPELIGDQP